MTRKPIHELFRSSAARFPLHTAIEWREHRITYRELDQRASALAQDLLARGIAPGAFVVIASESPIEVIAAILATLQTRGVFVPLDPRLEVTRWESVIAEAGPRWCLASPTARERLLGLASLTAEILPLGDRGAEPEIEGTPQTPPDGAPDPDAPAYVFFTSGSTGRPKGILGRLKAIDHFIRWEVDLLGLDAGIRSSQLTSPAFDAFLRDAFAPLTVGGTVCVPPDRETLLDGGRLVEWIDRSRLNLIHCTPSVFRSLLNQPLIPDLFADLRHVLLAGERLLASDVRRWQTVFGDRIELINLYGPSETTMTKLFYRVKSGDGEGASIPIGQPMPDTRVLVVDDRGQPCSPGKLGEILIRTPYRSLGYLNQPELTREVFVPNPFSDRPDDIVYRTGDLGRLREDGNFEFVGRRDQQVKIRGMRVELAPIEEQLRSHPAVADVAVIDRDDAQGNKLLCAYVVLKEELATLQLADFLRQRLPEAVVPSLFVSLEALPRTLSGKLDRRALPDPSRDGRPDRYEPPSTPVEEEICRLFSELLRVPQIGIHSHFLELGGHSLLVTSLLSRIRSSLGVELSLRDIFLSPTVKGLALEVTRLRDSQEATG